MPRYSAPLRHPVAAAIVCAAGQFALVVLILLTGKQMLSDASFQAVKLTAFASTLLLPVALVHVLRMWRSVGLDPEGLKPTGTIALCLVPAMLFLMCGLHLPAGTSLGNDLAIQLMNAFGEELLFRGVIFLFLIRLGPVRSIVVNGLLFGAMHLLHGFMDGDWQAALIQSAVSTVAGTLFTAIRYRTGSLWPPIVVHMLLNLAIMYSNVEPMAGASALFLIERLADAVEFGITLYLAAKILEAPGQRSTMVDQAIAIREQHQSV